MPSTLPLPRPLHYGLKGRDVWAVQRTLHQIGIRPQKKSTGFYGHLTEDQMREYKTRHDLPHTGGYGKLAHQHLYPRMDGYAQLRMKQAYEELHQESTIDKIVRIALYAYSQRDVIHYSQDFARRMSDFGPPPNVPNYTDCSGLATWVYKCAGAPDPNGFGYNGYGYTGTMTAHGTKVSLASLRKGDLIFYGFPVSHVAIYIGGGRVVSHGSEPGPLLLNMYYRSDVNHARRYF